MGNKRTIEVEPGQRFGSWTIEYEFTKGKNHKRRYVHCRCDCGTEQDIYLYHLLSGETRSCGCRRLENRKGDLTGLRFGHLTVICKERVGDRYYWKCKCDCGNEKYAKGCDLRGGSVASCGCRMGFAENIRKGLSEYCVDGTYVPGLKRAALNKNNTSGVTGVSWRESRGKWRAYIKYQHKDIHLGTYEKFEDAVAARKAAELEYFGKYLDEEPSIEKE